MDWTHVVVVGLWCSVGERAHLGSEKQKTHRRAPKSPTDPERQKVRRDPVPRERVGILWTSGEEPEAAGDRTEKEVEPIPDATLDIDVPVTRPFLENLFTTLRDDIEALKQELAADVKDIRSNVGVLEQRVDSLEWGSDNRDEELEEHKRKILALRNKTADLNYHLEDQKNHSRRCNIRVKGVLLQTDVGRLKDCVLRLFRYVAPGLVEQDIILDRTHRAG
ncbi:hypothetical protein NDU88_008357 [Pleurodeles waltl]|uniref:Uncharacterized protein n=1 Tax=Pleurodeles waltl TaxID=8319 RepID=A0AAV7PP29_PLEWA|nr:hypothetical protein NDU88_008357 [Pleurodeles waltl]